MNDPGHPLPSIRMEENHLSQLCAEVAGLSNIFDIAIYKMHTLELFLRGRRNS